ncbi:GNAT family N-acetyltransferase [Paraburkholderia rhizosphaerae]|uniref:Acetyltransferase (GNAT) family protein n=1 Tax=Paraburkholderia rhizosphaerae TaxID=480658 RepID=A0A4R8LML6_9BURK|nr:GNAT family N-acetyltransferase [Paraburkholderia rhizosphaerae]TDY46566.1 acetyltransferase (GNAT) family protein [Paraburkholderia rhizosphaerae]
MQKERAAAGNPTSNPSRVATVQRGSGPGSVELRRFDPARDSYEQLTAMLHRAFARLGMMGLNCLCVAQAPSATRKRAQAGDCFVAVCGGEVVGTMTLNARDAESVCDHYRVENVATLRQFGVEPAWQSRGIGKSLIAFAGHWAATRGYAQLALDTPYPAAHLLDFYRSQGFRIIDVVRFPERDYDSAILSKPPVAARTLASWSRRLELPVPTFPRAA